MQARVTPPAPALVVAVVVAVVGVVIAVVVALFLVLGILVVVFVVVIFVGVEFERIDAGDAQAAAAILAIRWIPGSISSRSASRRCRARRIPDRSPYVLLNRRRGRRWARPVTMAAIRLCFHRPRIATQDFGRDPARSRIRHRGWVDTVGDGWHRPRRVPAARRRERSSAPAGEGSPYVAVEDEAGLAGRPAV
ncbi:MAG: hypothetical protein R2752_10215 [Vicinamibacterales bacterium]